MAEDEEATEAAVRTMGITVAVSAEAATEVTVATEVQTEIQGSSLCQKVMVVEKA